MDIDFGVFVHTQRSVMQQAELPFTAYFQHQLRHMSVQKRFASSLQYYQNCYLKLGVCMLDKQDKMTCCCDTKIVPNVPSRDTCPCQLDLTGEDRICTIHHVIIQAMEVKKQSCSWLISFFDNNSCENETCFQNPGYNFLLDDSLSTSTESITFECTGTGDASVGIRIDMSTTSLCDEDDDMESIIYESSDDEDDICFDVFNFEVEIPTYLSSWNTSAGIEVNIQEKVQNTENNIINNKLYYKGRKLSKYHKCCINQLDNNNVSDKAVEKRVHFAEGNNLVTVHPLLVWNFAYKQSRRSTWLKLANDHAHFQGRINRTAHILEPVLKQKISQINIG